MFWGKCFLKFYVRYEGYETHFKKLKLALDKVLKFLVRYNFSLANLSLSCWTFLLCTKNKFNICQSLIKKDDFFKICIVSMK